MTRVSVAWPNIAFFFSTLSYGSKCKKHEAISHNISYTYQLVLYSLHPIFMFCAFTSPNQASP